MTVPFESVYNNLWINDTLTPTTYGEKIVENPAFIQNNEQMGYVFLEDATVKILRDKRASDYDMARISIQHGGNPTGGEYAYVMLPVSDLEQTKKYAATENIEIIAHTDAVHAVKHIKSGKIAANVFEPSSVCGIGINSPCSLIFTYQDNAYDIYLSDPTQGKNNKITLTFPYAVEAESDNAEILVQSNAVTVDVSKKYGSTFHIIVKKGD